MIGFLTPREMQTKRKMHVGLHRMQARFDCLHRYRKFVKSKTMLSALRMRSRMQYADRINAHCLTVSISHNAIVIRRAHTPRQPPYCYTIFIRCHFALRQATSSNRNER